MFSPWLAPQVELERKKREDEQVRGAGGGGGSFFFFFCVEKFGGSVISYPTVVFLSFFFPPTYASPLPCHF